MFLFAFVQKIYTFFSRTREQYYHSLYSCVTPN